MWDYFGTFLRLVLLWYLWNSGGFSGRCVFYRAFQKYTCCHIYLVPMATYGKARLFWYLFDVWYFYGTSKIDVTHSVRRVFRRPFQKHICFHIYLVPMLRYLKTKSFVTSAPAPLFFYFFLNTEDIPWDIEIGQIFSDTQFI